MANFKMLLEADMSKAVTFGGCFGWLSFRESLFLGKKIDPKYLQLGCNSIVQLFQSILL